MTPSVVSFHYPSCHTTTNTKPVSLQSQDVALKSQLGQRMGRPEHSSHMAPAKPEPPETKNIVFGCLHRGVATLRPAVTRKAWNGLKIVDVCLSLHTVSHKGFIEMNFVCSTLLQGIEGRGREEVSPLSAELSALVALSFVFQVRPPACVETRFSRSYFHYS